MSVRAIACVAVGIGVVGCAALETQSAQLPEDVASFVERRRICDHLRGEGPYSAERRVELEQGTEQYCRGTDKELAALMMKYRGNAAVATALGELEGNSEARK